MRKTAESNKANNIYDCPVEAALDVLGGKWGRSLPGSRRERSVYSELKRSLPSISERMLIKQLRRMEADGIVRRQQYPEVPPRVEYSLSEVGERLIPVLDHLGNWALKHLPERLSFLQDKQIGT